MRLGLAGRLAQGFLGSKLTPLFIAASLGHYDQAEYERQLQQGAEEPQ